MPLTNKQITELLEKELKRSYAAVPTITPQVGPLRWHNTAVRCVKRGCGVMTHYKIQGIPRCTVHALEELNEMLIAQGFRGVFNTSDTMNNPTPLPSGRILSATPIAYLEMGWAIEKFECIHGINLTKECNACAGKAVTS